MSQLISSRYLQKIIGGLICLLLAGTLQGAELTAREVIEKVRSQKQPETALMEIQMALVNQNDQRKLRTVKIQRKNYQNTAKASLVFLSPAKVRGTALLTYTYEQQENNESWLYLPEFSKVRRVNSGSKTDYFMGTDLTYYDLEGGASMDDYDFQFVDPHQMLGDHAVWVVEITPKEAVKQDVIQNTGYLKAQQWIRKDNLVTIKAKLWVNQAKRIKYLMASELEQIDGFWVARKVKVVMTKNDKELHSTLLSLQSIELNKPVDDHVFKVEHLSKGF